MTPAVAALFCLKYGAAAVCLCVVAIKAWRALDAVAEQSGWW